MKTVYAISKTYFIRNRIRAKIRKTDITKPANSEGFIWKRIKIRKEQYNLEKEIAKLINISSGGVAMSRYRLHKKFGLHKKESLTGFLMRVKTKKTIKIDGLFQILKRMLSIMPLSH